jgi:hypothetical protein
MQACHFYFILYLCASVSLCLLNNTRPWQGARIATCFYHFNIYLNFYFGAYLLKLFSPFFNHTWADCANCANGEARRKCVAQRFTQPTRNFRASQFDGPPGGRTLPCASRKNNVFKLSMFFAAMPRGGLFPILHSLFPIPFFFICFRCRLRCSCRGLGGFA